MSSYELSIGGPRDADDVDSYTHFVDLDVTISATSTGTWTAELSDGSDFTDSLFAEAWVYVDDELLLRGYVESFTANQSVGTTTISGRGMLADLEQKTTVKHYQDTNVHHAIMELWGETKYEATTLVPNRNILDTLQNITVDHYGLWAALGNQEDIIHTDGVTADNNDLQIDRTNFVLDDVDPTGDQQPTVSADANTDYVGMILRTDTALETCTAGMKMMDGSMEIEAVSDTETHGFPRKTHHFTFEFTDVGDEFRPTLTVDDKSFDVIESEVFVPDTELFATIDSIELDGTVLDVLKDLHDIGGYEFSVDSWNQRSVRSYPVGTVVGEPDWNIVSKTKATDVVGYANNVTVRGRTLDDGTVNEATASDQTEIDDLKERDVGTDGVISKFERNPNLQTSDEVQSRADRLLSSSITELDSSGTLEIDPTYVEPGYSYEVSAFGNAFPHEPNIGANALYFRGDEYQTSTRNDRYDDDTGGEHPDHSIFYVSYSGERSIDPNKMLEFLIFPEDLSALGDSEYYTLWTQFWDDSIDAEIRLYGDGSILLGEDPPTWPDYVTTTAPNTIASDKRQRLSITYDEETDVFGIYVDGTLEHEETMHPWFSGDNEMLIGCDKDYENAFKGGIDDIRWWTSEDPFDVEHIAPYTLTDLIIDDDADTSDLDLYLRCDDKTDPENFVNDGSAILSSLRYESGTIFSAQYQDNIGQLDELTYSLGSGDTVTLNFNIDGRLDTELIKARRVSDTVRRSL